MGDLSLPEFADKMNEIIPVLMKGFSRVQTIELFKVKVTLPQLLLLNFLNIQGQSKMTDLAKFMHVTTAAVTGIVDRLVRDGYLSRVYDNDDRRVIRVKITSKGNELLKKINQERRKVIIDIFQNISQADRMHYLRILNQIKEILSKENGKQK